MNETQFPVIQTQRLVLSLPTEDDAQAYADFYRGNREHLAPWEPVHSPEIETKAFWSQILPVYRDEYTAGAGLRFSMKLRDKPGMPLIGLCFFMQIARAASQSCIVGYNIDRDHQGHGYMYEALAAAIPYVFEVLQLHRLQATYMPTNVRSAKILRKLGFVVEGYARDYLYIAGAWRDHVMVSLTNPAHAQYGDL